MEPGTEPISDDELLYRRIPVNPEYFNPAVRDKPARDSYAPRKNDLTGLSLSRAKYKSPAEAARSPQDKRYYVAVLRAGDIRRHGIRVVPAPWPNDPGHAELPDLVYENRRQDETKEHMRLLAEKLTIRVEGPFP